MAERMPFPRHNMQIPRTARLPIDKRVSIRMNIEMKKNLLIENLYLHNPTHFIWNKK